MIKIDLIEKHMEENKLTYRQMANRCQIRREDLVLYFHDKDWWAKQLQNLRAIAEVVGLPLQKLLDLE